MADFINALRRAITRQIEFIRVLPLHGTPFRGGSIEEAVDFIEQYDEASPTQIFVRYEIEIRYVNGDFIKADYQDKERVIEFLHIHQPPIGQGANSADA